MYQLVVALGNPGNEYVNTRHNIAWILFDQHPQIKDLNWKSKYKGLYSEANIGGEKTFFLKPQTYMNLSGESVQPFAQFFKIPSSKILVIHDELDLPLGQAHFKMGGGLAGHNGLKSIAQTLGTDEFARLRIGIGRPQHGSVSDWVLSGFKGDEEINLSRVIEKLAQPLIECVISGVTPVGNKWNKKDLLA